MPQPDALVPGQEYGPYRILEPLGRGGMGNVYLARDERFPRLVAIKAMAGEIAADPRTRERFLEEAGMAARVQSPYVATLHDVIDRPEGPLLVMEYVKGRRLDHLIKEGPLEPARAIRYGIEITEALETIHAAGIIHRDLKPANVMVAENDHVKVLDFGVALQAGPIAIDGGSAGSTRTRLTADGAAVGTVAYMSPEQLRGERLDGRSDLFSLGTILFEGLTGAHPFAGQTQAETMGAILHREPGGVADRKVLRDAGATGELALRLLEKNRDRRPSSARAVREALSEARTRPARRWIAALAALAVVLVLVAVAVGTATRDRTSTSIDPTSPLSAAALRPAVAVLPFDPGGIGGDPAYAAMVADLVGASLGESSSLRAVGFDRVAELLEDLPADTPAGDRIERVAAGAAPAWIAVGKLYREGEEIIATVEVLDGSGREQAGSFTAQAPRALDLAGVIATRIQNVVGAPAVAGFGVGRSPSLHARNDAAQVLYTRARGRARVDDYAGAISLAERALDEDPEFIDARILLADQLWQAGYEGRARDEAGRADAAVERSGLPADGRQALAARAVRARVFLRNEEALAALERRVALYPDDVDALLSLAEAQRASGADGQRRSLEVLDRAAVVDPLDPRVPLSRAYSLARLGRADEAVELLEDVERRFRSFEDTAGLAEVAALRAWIAFREARYGSSRDLYREAAELYRDAGVEARAFMAMKSEGDTLLQQWKLDEAAARYRDALEGLAATGHYSQVARALASLGAQRFRAGDYEEAEQRLRSAVEEARKLGNDRLRISPLITLSSLLTTTGRFAEGRERAEQARDLAVETGRSFNARIARQCIAFADRQAGRPDDAAAELRALLSELAGMDGVDWERAYVLGQLAEVEEMHERPARALAGVDAALALMDPDRASAELALRLACRARVRATLGLAGEAAADLDAARAAAGGLTGSPELDDALAATEAMVSLASTSGADAALEAARPGARAGSTWWNALRLVRAEALLRSGRAAEALTLAQDVRGHAWTGAARRALAGLTMARALRATGDAGAAAMLAMEVADEARELGMQRTEGGAVALAVSLDPRVAEAGSLRRRGREAIGAYLEPIPAELAPAVRAVPEIERTLRTLGAEE